MTRVLATLLLALSLLVSGCGSGSRAPSAAEQVPALGVALDRVDAALASHHFAAARERLRALKAVVLAARASGDLSAADAQPVLDAVTRLMATLPGDDASPTESPSSTTSATARPSRQASKPPEKSPTIDPTRTPVAPSATPTPSSSPTASPTTAPSPTGNASPIGVTTATP